MQIKFYLQVLFITLTGIIVCSAAGYGQENKGVEKPLGSKVHRQQQQQNFYRRVLLVDSVKAQKVSLIQDNYKAEINKLVADTGLNEAGRRAKIKVLMNAKNQQLRLILNPAQQAKIIPTTELEQPLPPKSN